MAKRGQPWLIMVTHGKKYVTSCSCEHMLSTYCLRTLVCKWSGFSICCLFWLRVLMMVLMDYDVMLFDIYVLEDVIDEFPLSVENTWQIKDDTGISGPPWTPYRVREWIVLVWVFLFMHMWHMIRYIMILFMDHWQCFVDGCRLMIAC